jgi:HTH-type transcriptional regulator, osmoprotectant uptake regulator
MREIVEVLVNEIGLQYVKFGHSELLGRVVGLLIASERALSEEEIAAELGVSKSPVNQITRRLEELNQVRRVRIPGDRKYYYEIAPDVFLRAAAYLAQLYEENVRIADTHLRSAVAQLQEAPAEEQAPIRLVCERLLEMRAFHSAHIAAHRRFLDEWKRLRAQVPSVEEYIAGSAGDAVPAPLAGRA